MKLHELFFRMVPGILVFLGVTGLYFASETRNLIHNPLYTSLVVLAGLALLVDGFMMMITGWADTAHPESTLSAE